MKHLLLLTALLACLTGCQQRSFSVGEQVVVVGHCEHNDKTGRITEAWSFSEASGHEIYVVALTNGEVVSLHADDMKRVK